MPITTMPTGLTELEKVDEIIESHYWEESALIGILQDVQREFNYLPRPLLKHIAQRLDIPLNRIYSVATFYRAFTLKPRGKYTISACLGTACHVRGGKRVVEELERRLGIKAPDTTNDLKYSLQAVNCLGACALGPVVVVNGEYHAQITPKKVSGILKQYQ
ncbi:MAG: NAD(P)H-dependent oxidoreductase subunit E [Planctomycetota bacterium]|nr:NAD(P)H-dependent oxidoreductase subunit E [Planctomycetota bacterium]MDI6787732.1 NAD(P)H-dependent oxidoreductase subunit E [Planctomycetota bacterium]